MKNYTIKKKKAGQFFNESGTFLAKNWHDAKKQFTKIIFNDMINDISFVEKNGILVRVDGTGTDEININKPFDTFEDDVYTWTIRKA